MKKIIGSIISIQCMLILITGCNFKGNTVDHKGKSCDTLITENFDFFLHKFYSDSVFQISRIIFPLESEKVSDKEYAEALKDSNIIEISKNNHAYFNKDNWIILSDTFFKNDSIVTIDGVKYKRRFYKTPKFIEENILYADPEQVMMISKFQLINKKWYMVDFKDGFANERD
jgi:hypothetical protein